MSCTACEDFRVKGDTYPYRWKGATVEILACQEHATEIIAVLNEAQSRVTKEADHGT